MRPLVIIGIILIVAFISVDDVGCWRRRRRRRAPPPPAPKPKPKPNPPVVKTDPPAPPATTQNPQFVTLDNIRYSYVGCFNSPGHLPPRLKELIFTERDQSLAVWNGHLIDWKNWDKYMGDLIKRCALKAHNSDYKVFGLRYYGECWADRSVTDAEASFGGATKAPSECVKEDYAVCQNGDPRCIGKHHGLAVYQVLPQ